MRSRGRALVHVIEVAFRAAPWLFVRTLGLQVIESIGSMLTALWMKLVTDGVVAADSRLAVRAGLALGATIALNLLANIGRFHGEIVLQERVAFEVDRRLMALSAGVPGIEHHERPDYRDELSLVRSQRQALAGSAGAIVYNVQMIVLVVTSVGLLASVHPVMLVLPLLALPSVAAAGRSASLGQRALEVTAEPTRKASHLFDLATSASAGKELRVFGLGGVLLQRHSVLWRRIDGESTRAGLRGAGLSAGSWLLFAAGYVASITLVAVLAARGQATPGDVLMAFVLGSRVNTLVAGAVAMALWLMQSLRTVQRYLWLVDYARDARAAQRGRIPPPVRIDRGIHFENVSFVYPGTDTAALRDVTLDLPAGATVAVVGENGAGKTTIVKLLCRLYEPTAGRILVDGVDLLDLDVESWRAATAGGFQDFARLELVASESVGVGDLTQIADAAAVRGALDRAGALDVLDALPDGLQTQLGRTFDGLELSTGQWQKLALGRAMMRASPLLLVLDEPTAALDAETEHVLFERYAGAARRAASSTGAVTVLVSHRFSTVRMADLIVVVDGGRVIEQGTHAELVAAGGTYAELYSLQARAYA